MVVDKRQLAEVGMYSTVQVAVGNYSSEVLVDMCSENHLSAGKHLLRSRLVDCMYSQAEQIVEVCQGFDKHQKRVGKYFLAELQVGKRFEKVAGTLVEIAGTDYFVHTVAVLDLNIINI